MDKYKIDVWDKNIISKQQGLYYLFINDEIVYIGKALDIRQRLKCHFNPMAKWQQRQIDHSKITHIAFAIGDYDKEFSEIEKYKPKWNVSGNFDPNYDDYLCDCCYKRHNPAIECDGRKMMQQLILDKMRANKKKMKEEVFDENRI